MQNRHPPQCLRRNDRPPQATCKIYVLDLSLVAEKLGLPECNEDDFVVDPLEGKLLPHPRLVMQVMDSGNAAGSVGPRNLLNNILVA